MPAKAVHPHPGSFLLLNLELTIITHAWSLISPPQAERRAQQAANQAPASCIVQEQGDVAPAGAKSPSPLRAAHSHVLSGGRPAAFLLRNRASANRQMTRFTPPISRGTTKSRHKVSGTVQLIGSLGRGPERPRANGQIDAAAQNAAHRAQDPRRHTQNIVGPATGKPVCGLVFLPPSMPAGIGSIRFRGNKQN